jgi:gamma-glutamylcyclotransferase (GGCT)/AIG2-like uncharacterized protein YtfP
MPDEQRGATNTGRSIVTGDEVKLFVYGTLRPPRPGHPPEDCRFYPEIASHVRRALPAHLSDAVLYDLGAYPGSRPGGGTVHGDLLIVDRAALTITDRIEGHPRFFRRARTTVYADEGTVAAWVYWAPEELVAGRPPIPSGDWLARSPRRF